MTDEMLLAILRTTTESRQFLANRKLNDSALRCLYCLFSDRRPWTISALADATGLTRVTVRARVRIGVRKGFMSHKDGSVTLTPAGCKRLKVIFSEYLEELQGTLRTLARLIIQHQQ